MAATDATAVPVKNQAFRVTFPILDADGDLVTAAGSLDSEVGIDETTFTDVTAEAVELATASGMYRLDLSAAEMNGDTIAIIVKSAGGKTTPIVLYPQESGDIKVEVQNIAANAITAAAINADAITAAKIANGAIDAATFAAGAIDAAAIANNAIDAATFAAGAIDAAAIAADAITAAKIANGAIDAATFAAGAIDAAAINADAVTKLRSIVSGTSDAGGTTTTLRDAIRTEIDDTFNLCWLLITSGTDANRVRLITDFDATLDDIVFAPAVSAAIGAGVTYEILPASAVDVQSWLATESAGVAPNALVAGRVDADVGNMQANSIAVGVIATDAITNTQIAAGAITSSEAPNLDAAITTRATPAEVNTQVLDVLNVDTFVESAGVPAATATLVDKIGWLATLARNKILQTATVQTLRNDADAADIATAAVSDDATTATRAEWV